MGPASPISDNTDDGGYALPTVICINPRAKILPEEVPVADLIIHRKEKPDENVPLVWEPDPGPPSQPYPRHSLSIAWSPPSLCFELLEEKVVQQLTVWNSATHLIYVQCCGLWDDTAKLGAGWKSYPRKRFLLAPGLVAKIGVSAKPREYPSPVPMAYVGLQLAASHTRDIVTGYFVVPIQVKFKNYIPPPPGEG
ncbi:hypothetical protein MSG28_001675 [Choristoneura fumiferana]|uniref:Uncharacterized protein n=1 Tax=Choristoneura fumiferana TaxID=7141 RepID=A0ACC0KVL0_CHOFU|nr:hypothetical protein MSG28_001675 [Choristoneura fumiferana]